MTALGSTFSDFFRPETINWNQGGQTTVPSQFSNILGKIGQVAGGLDNFAYENQLGQYAPPEVISNGADVGAYNQALQGAYSPYNDMMSRREQLMQRRQERERKRKFQGVLGSIGRTGGFAGPLEPYSDVLMSAESPEEFAALGKMFQSMEPETTANIREYQLAQQDPEFGAYLDKRGQRSASGTEAIVSNLMSEDPNLSYYEALALAQGLARKGLSVQGGRVTPMAGTPEALGTLAAAEEGAKQQEKLKTAAQMETQKKKGAALGDAEVMLAEYEAMKPKLDNVVSRLSELAKTATYTKAGQLWAAAQKELGNEVSQSDIDRAAYISTVDNEVLPLLRQTFGAAFTEREGQSLKATLGDPNATPAQKQAILDAFIQNKMTQIQSQSSLVEKLGGQSGQTQVRRYNPNTGGFE